MNLWKNHLVSGSGIDYLPDDFIGTILSIDYDFIHSILSNTILSVYHFVRAILS